MASVFEATAGKSIGYTTGLGGAVTQATSKSTGVTLNKPVAPSPPTTPHWPMLLR